MSTPVQLNDRQVCIVGYARTPVGSFLGDLSEFSATDLGAHAIKESIRQSKISPSHVKGIYMGNTVSAGVGQGPARIAALKAGLPSSVHCCTVNKVCSSGMKAIILGAQEILLGLKDCVVCGGMESMSQAPRLNVTSRTGSRLGTIMEVDSLLSDGLTDASSQRHMGDIAENYAKDLNITREDQDAFALESFQRAINARNSGYLKNEIVGIEKENKKKKTTQIIEKDEQLDKFNEEKMKRLPPCFLKDGTITAANASALNDGAAALVLVSRKLATELSLKVIATIEGFDEHSEDPLKYGIAPVGAVEKVLKKAGWLMDDVDMFEINESFSVIALAIMKLLKLSPSKVNVLGGAVAFGHPIGASGARIVCTLLNALTVKGKEKGCAALCNGGGEGCAILVRRISDESSS
ncbi:acetyl-CoA acetyltransferase [Monocercomonoides exilis]|uniref:acetyl-CoA acetyltransferase n=1 Tax=Monocercomonoides exilis TaxID=2049356 RepID=UPI00355AAFCC|nr:acetyl-CoA acetyltransferase [Monocercomonoides exilis]|eukprot:MONOS_6235.1-p1 / transcript=MONOS_6235.1 / gene=MONOS_6235 / organism=Monocercomonoides_exilis_PA203 / gene_product=acetyl-CoA acetyltransferase [2.3.1.9] / transcript_product=acetyl-CoA acetyltransferase [2.3.1.9] / location=Mono_scaffold00193:88991-90865(+) / protein_length=408 / sequence_SO=supercontig / SO=protein_coding / is_pseudo=false